MLTPGAGAADFLVPFFFFLFSFCLCDWLHTYTLIQVHKSWLYLGDILRWDVVSKRLGINCSNQEVTVIWGRAENMEI